MLPIAVPHRLGSIAIPEVISSQAFTPGGQPIRVVLRNKGYLDKLRVRISGTVTTGAGDVTRRPGFPHNTVRRFLLDGPDLKDTHDLDGWMTKLEEIVGYSETMLQPGSVPPALQETFAAAGNPGADHLPPWLMGHPVEDEHGFAASTANVVDLNWVIDLKRNHRDHRGLAPLIATDETALVIEPGALADIWNVPGTVTGTDLTIEVVQYMRTPPVAGVAGPGASLDWKVKYAQQSLTGFVAGADADVILRGEGILLNAIAYVVLDDDTFPSNPVADIDDIGYIVNEDKRIDGLDPEFFLRDQAAKYPRGLPLGVFAFDGDADQADIPFLDQGLERAPGWISVPEGRNATLRFAIAAAATLDNARIVTATKRLVRAS